VELGIGRRIATTGSRCGFHAEWKLPTDIQAPVVLRAEEIADIRQHSLLGPELLLAGVVEANGSVRFHWSLEQLEEVLGCVAASANHTTDRKPEMRPNRISDKLAASIDCF
jgi:hypothetical protein